MIQRNLFRYRSSTVSLKGTAAEHFHNAIQKMKVDEASFFRNYY